MEYKYGEFTDGQIKETKEYIRKQIFFLLLIVDPKTRDRYVKYDVLASFNNLLRKLGGLNSVLNSPSELVTVISLLEAALIEYTSDHYQYSVYRKLILDAGAEVMKIKEV